MKEKAFRIATLQRLHYVLGRWCMWHLVKGVVPSGLTMLISFKKYSSSYREQEYRERERGRDGGDGGDGGE